MRHLSLSNFPWRFRDATEDGAWHPATVPGCVHADLLKNRLISDPFPGTNELGLQWIEERDWEYRCEFTVPAELIAERMIDLVADGLDTAAVVTLNGRRLGETDNMFAAHRWSVKSRLRSGINRLAVRFGSAMHYIRTHRRGHQPKEFNDPVGRCQVIRKQQCQFGWDWGPRLVTAGIWREIRLEGRSGNRLESVSVRQQHAPDGSVSLRLTPELAHAERGVTFRHRLSLSHISVAEGAGCDVRVSNPQLWWPNGHGPQPLYTLEVEAVRATGARIGKWTRRIGLREVTLDRSADGAGGAHFRFVVNRRPIFAKGANWIPAHSFVAGLNRDDYRHSLTSAAAAHMNMIRVWGGGIYEHDAFYDLCDELGLLVWQDFMFACSIYPGDPSFLRSVRTEATQQVRRLRHHACLALWSGNNEIEQLNLDLLKRPALRRNYDRLFNQLLPRVVATIDGVTAYWPSSAHRPDGDHTPAGGERAGDTHFWDIASGRELAKQFERHRFRFVSEFGMQSFPSLATCATFCPPDDTNVFGPTFRNHQKHPAGNQIILDYVSRLYRFPKSQEELIYLSQLNQARCVQIGVEHWRRHMPHCMGALYWQLNDCWPATSWSSIEFTGRWRALHYAARRFFAPALACAWIPGSETATIGNYRRSDVREAQIFTVYDGPADAQGSLRWWLLHVDGRTLRQQSQPVALRYGESVLQQRVDLAEPIARFGRDNLVLRFALDIASPEGGAAPFVRVSENTAFLSPPCYVPLPRAETRVSVRRSSPQRAQVVFTSSAFQHRFCFDLHGLRYRASDNFFELFANEPRTIDLEFDQPTSITAIHAALEYHSLVDTY